MSETILTTNPTINNSLLSVLLSKTFIKDFHVDDSELVCSFKEKIEDILPLVTTFLDTFNDIIDTQFYLEVHGKCIGILKTYDTEPFSFTNELLFQPTV